MASNYGDTSPEFLYSVVEQSAKEAYLRALKIIPPDVVAVIEKAQQTETHTLGKKILGTILQNIKKAEQTDTLVCQDTGIPICMLRLGEDAKVSLTRVLEAIRKGCERATIEYPLRPNIVHPITRENTNTNTGNQIPVFHIDPAPGVNYIEFLLLPKGSGSENMSFARMLNPADGIRGIKKFVLESVVQSGGNPCPPSIIGIGIGGSFDLCAKLSKEAIARPLGTRNPDPTIASLELELLAALNETGVGPMGLGGVNTALAVHINVADTHISQLPVAINTQCWRGERAGVRIYPDGRVEEIWSLNATS